MKLEDKFFGAFFYPFFFGILASITIVITILSHYSKGYLDERTAGDVYEVETTYADSYWYYYFYTELPEEINKKPADFH